MATIVAHRANPGADIDGIVTIIGQLTTLANESKVDYTAARTLINELKTVQATNRTLINELKTDVNLLLAKLDADTGLDASDYVATLAISAASIAAIATADAGATSADTVDTLEIGY